MVAYKICITAAFLLIISSFISTAAGDKFPYTIYGYVYDNEGDMIEGIEVLVINERTKETMSNITDEHGFYKVNLGNMPSGWENGDEITIIAEGKGKYLGWMGEATIFVSDSEISQRVDITLHPPLVADFTYVPSKIKEGETVNFKDTSTHTNAIINYTWDFGDGNISYEKNPSHVYAKNGTYTVKLTIKDEEGLTDVATKQIEVLDVQLIVSFTYKPEKPKVNEEVYFNASINESANYTWDFGDGNISHEKNPMHKYSKSGTYRVTLNVVIEGEKANTSRDIEILPSGKTPGFSFLLLVLILIIIIFVKKRGL